MSDGNAHIIEYWPPIRACVVVQLPPKAGEPIASALRIGRFVREGLLPVGGAGRGHLFGGGHYAFFDVVTHSVEARLLPREVLSQAVEGLALTLLIAGLEVTFNSFFVGVKVLLQSLHM